LWSQAVLKMDSYRCQRCDSPATQAHHIFSRRYQAVRYEVNNGVSLCYPCHIYWAHSEHEKFRDFILGWMGEQKFNLLKLLAYEGKKPDLRMCKIRLQKYLENFYD